MIILQKTKAFLPLTILYFLTSIIEIYADLSMTNWLLFATKPLLMVWLIILFLSNGFSEGGKFSIAIMFGLIFSLGGDIFLMFRKDDLFIFGLGSFLLAHIAYIYGFIMNTRESSISTGKILGNFFLLIPFIIFLRKFMGYIGPFILGNAETQNFILPVWVYGITITTMGYFATTRASAVSKLSFWTIFFGAILFISSDSIIAINKFAQEIPYSPIWIMSTYVSAQYLIVVGCIAYIKKI
jgi:uncharacterized membrane protein YhhN